MTASSSIQFMAIGGGSSIGASCYLVKIGRTTVLIDCGIDPKTSPKVTFSKLMKLIHDSGLLNDLTELTAIVLTHAHTDHSGLLPALFREIKLACATKPRARLPFIYASRATKSLLPFVYRNILNFSDDAPYSQSDVDQLLDGDRMKTPDPSGELDWLQPDLGQVFLYPTSHLLGAMMVELIVEGHRFLYTGDLKLTETPTLAKGVIPEQRPDLLVIDGTYAAASNRAVTDWAGAKDQIFAVLDKHLSQRRTLLFPSFALGRTQDVLALVLEHADRNPELTHYIYLDGQSRTVTQDIYPGFSDVLSPRFVELIKRHGWRLHWVDNEASIQELIRLEIEGYPSVIIASSGMLMPGSASYRWAQELVYRPGAVIVLTGYIVEELQEELFDQRIFDDKRIAQPVERLGISGHASMGELQSFIDLIGAQHIGIVHCGGGDLEGPGSLIDWLQNRSISCEIAREGYRINSKKD